MPPKGLLSNAIAQCTEFRKNPFKPEFCTNCQGHESQHNGGKGVVGRKTGGDAGRKVPLTDGDFCCAPNLKLALAKMVENNYRAVVCTVDGDNGIQMVGAPIPFGDDDLAGDLSKARDQSKDTEGLIVVVRPVKKPETQVIQVNTGGLRVRAKMVLANATLWVRINGNCNAKGNETVIDGIDELKPEIFKL